MTVACPHCSKDITQTMHDRWDYAAEDGDVITETCPRCGKSLKVRCRVDIDYSVAFSKREQAEREKYAKRMRGDWS